MCNKNKTQLVYDLASNLNVGMVNASAGKIEITYTDLVPEKAADIVNHVTQNYLNYDKERKTEGTKNIMKFINERIIALGDELANTEKEIQNFKLNFQNLKLNRYSYVIKHSTRPGQYG